MGNCLFLRARGWGIDPHVRKKLQIPGGVPGGVVTGRIEPCIIPGAESCSVLMVVRRYVLTLRIELKLRSGVAVDTGIVRRIVRMVLTFR